MNIEMIDIKEFNERYKDRNNLRIFVYSLIVVVTILSLMFSLFVLKKDLYYEGEIFVIDGKQVLVNVLKKDLEKLTGNNALLINDKKYQYDVLQIENIDSSYLYYQLFLDINLGRYHIENNTLQYKILLQKENIFRYFVRIIKGGE